MAVTPTPAPNTGTPVPRIALRVTRRADLPAAVRHVVHHVVRAMSYVKSYVAKSETGR